MFYKELYTELGKLFYYTAGIDGKVQVAEREALQELIKSKWKPLEDSKDEFGTDQSAIINFSFDYEESENAAHNALESFEDFYRENKESFSPQIIQNILQTVTAIADAYRDKNKNEKLVLDKIKKILHSLFRL